MIILGRHNGAFFELFVYNVACSIQCPTLGCFIMCLCSLAESMESIKFKEIETRFLNLFNLPPEEKLVNCKCPGLLVLYSHC